MSENLNSEQSNNDPHYSEWDSLMAKSNEQIQQNFLDDKEHIANKQKRDRFNYSQADVMPKDQDETTEEYSNRIAGIHEDFPRQAEEGPAEYQKRMQAAYEDGSILQSVAERMIDSESVIGQSLKNDLLNIDDMKNGGRFDEERAKVLRREVLEKALKEQKALGQAEAKRQSREDLKAKLEVKKRAQAEADAKRKIETGDGDKTETGDNDKKTPDIQIIGLKIERKDKDKGALASKLDELNAIAAEKQAEKDTFQAKIDELGDIAEKKSGPTQEEFQSQIDVLSDIIDKKTGPLVGINADFTEDKEDYAHDFAERELNDEVAHSNFIKKIWKGTLFKKYYQKKYEQEIYSGNRQITHNGKKISLDEYIEDLSAATIKRFVIGASTEYTNHFIHNKAGERIDEVDARTTEVVKGAIEWYASAKIPEDGSEEELKAEFGNRIKRLQAEGRDNGKPVNGKLINNYLDMAIQARECAEHGMAMERIMEGFKVYNANVRDGIRSEAHRDNLDKIIDKLEESKIGNFISSPVLAAAVGAAWGLAQSGSRALAGPLGGLGVAGAVAGLKERNRVTEDRVRMMRDAAQNYQYEGQQQERPKGKRAKYEARLGGTLYDMRPASELTNGLNQAIESGDHESIMKAIAEARVRVELSDADSKDLISYSSADNIGTERLNLDIALISAEKNLSEEDKAALELQKTAIQEHIMEDIDASDRDFRKVRTAQALKQAGKSIVIGGAFFFGSQEIIAAVDPGKIGLLEKSGILKTANRDDAKETILASLAGPRGFSAKTIENVSGDDAANIKRYKDAGYEQLQTKQAWTETKQDLVDIKPKSSTNRVKAIYDGWANNGTKGADGNELNIEVRNNAIISNMTGNSTMNGQAFNYNQLAKAGNIKGYITVGGAKFEVASSVNSAGQLTWPIDANGAITTTTGESIKAIGDNGEKLFKYFEVALDNGPDANGFTHIMPFATETGADSFRGTIQQVVETAVEHPATYSFVKHIPHDIYYGGVAMPGVTARTGLGTATAPNVPPTAPAPIPEAPAPAAPEVPAQPEPTSDTSETSAPTPASTGNQIDSTSVPNSSSQDSISYEEALDSVQNRIGEEGVRYLADERPFDKVDSTGFGEWWNSLSDEARREVTTLLLPRALAENNTGHALHTWLQRQGLI